MKHVKLFEEFAEKELGMKFVKSDDVLTPDGKLLWNNPNRKFELNERAHAVFTETDGGKNILLFRGQSGHFYEEKPQGYFKSYGMVFTSSDINNAFFYTKPKQYDVREILVFKVPNNIMRIYGKYIDRAHDEKIKAKDEGYDGIMSNVGELMFDQGEVGLFKLFKPIARYRTTTGAFDSKDVREMKKYGLSQFNVTQEKELDKSINVKT